MRHASWPAWPDTLATLLGHFGPNKLFAYSNPETLLGHFGPNKLFAYSNPETLLGHFGPSKLLASNCC